MTTAQNPFGLTQTPEYGWYSGYNINATFGSRTATNADLPLGAVVQEDPHASHFTGQFRGKVFSLTTSAFNTPVAIVDPDAIEASKLADINTLDTAVANKRKGGEIPIARSGIVRARVQANCTAGQTRLVATAGSFVLSGFSAGTVDQNNLQLGANGVIVAIADETVDTSGAPALVRVRLRQQPI